MSETESGTVLVVDDDEAVADVYARQLSEGHDVLTAYDGNSALDRVTAQVDVVLLDRRMPDLSGREVLERIQERDLDCSVIIVTAIDPGFDIIDMGFDDYIVKPVSKAELERSVSEAVNRLDRDELVREYLALASKVATLRVEKDPAELAKSEEYEELTDRLERLKRRANIEDEDIDSPLEH